MTISEAINIAVERQQAGDAAGAEAIYRDIIAQQPTIPEPYFNLGTLLDAAGRYAEAIALFRRAVALRPDFAEAHWNLGVSLLRQADFAAAWPEYEWRWKVPTINVTRILSPKPLWNGEELNGRRILLYAEQGLGDTIQFARYVPMVAKRGGRIILGCRQELVRLLKPLEGVEVCVPQPGPAPADFSFHCTLPSLPGVFATNLNTIPAAPYYVAANSTDAAKWAARLPADGRRRVGLAWAGRPDHPHNFHRSMHLHRLTPLAKAPGIHWFSLQKGESAGQKSFWPVPLTDWTAELNDFADTAGLIAGLDLVIAVDTSVAHLAAAMGKPVWMLIPFVPDWRWMLGREDSPWYPSVRLFRQEKLDDWQIPLARILEKLQKA